MRLVVVGHPLIQPYYQEKYVALKRLHPALEIRIVVPRRMAHPFGMRYCEVHPALDSREVQGLGSGLSTSHMTYLLDPLRLGLLLREFQPDAIHVEEEPQALITQEVVALRAAFCPQAALTVFTWDNLLRRRGFPLSTAKRLLRRVTRRQVSAIVCGNQEAERLLRERENFTGRTAVAPQFGVDPAEHEPGMEVNLRRQLGLAGGLVVGYAGRLVPEKGIALLLQALERLPAHPWKLLLVGSGPLENEIRSRWMTHFPGRIVHVPAVPQGDVPRYLRCMDIFVLSSYATPVWKEQFGLALAQAMLLGIPSVVSSSGAIPEVAGPGAWVCAEGSVESLAEALRALLESSILRRELGTRARGFALHRYTWDAVAARYLEIFQQAAGERVLPQPAYLQRSPVTDTPKQSVAAAAAPRKENPKRDHGSPATGAVARLESVLRALRRWAHRIVPAGRSPEVYRRLVRAIYRRMVYDPKTRTVTVRKGELAGAVKYGQFCEADFEFALGKYEPEIVSVFEEYCRPGMTVFDIGANAGHHLLRLSKLCGATGHVHAFEPVPENVTCLKETLRLNRLSNVTLHGVAVSDHEGSAEFKYGGVFDGLACLATGGHGRSMREMLPQKSIQVQTVELDAFCERLAIARLGLIKMDVEGAELLCLRGMRRTLRTHRPVLVMELWGADHVAQAPGILSQLGYEMRALSSWQGWIAGEKVETRNVLAVPSRSFRGSAEVRNQEAENKVMAESFAQRGE
ncbi:MAG: FkbM family methyltransferase [Acidipila sp.]|nr:FkbM family methyltransferase [Acidipila sp.]